MSKAISSMIFFPGGNSFNLNHENFSRKNLSKKQIKLIKDAASWKGRAKNLESELGKESTNKVLKKIIELNEEQYNSFKQEYINYYQKQK